MIFKAIEDKRNIFNISVLRLHSDSYLLRFKVKLVLDYPLDYIYDSTKIYFDIRFVILIQHCARWIGEAIDDRGDRGN